LPAHGSAARAGTRQPAPELIRQLRGELDWIVMKCLEKSRSCRYETAAALALDVQHHLRDEPVAAGPPSTTYKIQKFAKRNKRLIASAGAVTAALVLGLALAITGFVQARRERDRAVAARQSETAQRMEAQAKTHEARFQAYVANVIAADAALQRNEPAIARRRLAEAPAEYRNWEWKHLSGLLDGSLRTIPGRDENSVRLALSPEGKLAAISAES